MYVYKVKKLYNDMREPLKSKVVLRQYKHCVWSVCSNGMRLGSGGQLKWLYTTPVGYQDVCRGSLGNLALCTWFEIHVYNKQRIQAHYTWCSPLWSVSAMATIPSGATVLFEPIPETANRYLVKAMRPAKWTVQF